MKKPNKITIRYSNRTILTILLILTISTACSPNNASNANTSGNNQSASQPDVTDTSASLSCLPEMPATVSGQSQDQKLAAVIYDQAIGVYETENHEMLYCLERYPEPVTKQSEYALCEIYQIEFSPDKNFLGIAAIGRGYGSHVVFGPLVVWDMETGQITQNLSIVITKDTENFSFNDDSSEVTFRECLEFRQGFCIDGFALKSVATSGSN